MMAGIERGSQTQDDDEINGKGRRNEENDGEENEDVSQCGEEKGGDDCDEDREENDGENGGGDASESRNRNEENNESAVEVGESGDVADTAERMDTQDDSNANINHRCPFLNTQVRLTGTLAVYENRRIMFRQRILREMRRNIDFYSEYEEILCFLDVDEVTRVDVINVFNVLKKVLTSNQINEYLQNRFRHQAREEIEIMVKKALSFCVLSGMLRRFADKYYFRIPYEEYFSDFVKTPHDLIRHFFATAEERSNTEQAYQNARREPIISITFSELTARYFSANNMATRARYNLESLLGEHTSAENTSN